MRNWHHKVIKIQEARSLITNSSLKNGDENLYIGVIEGEIEYVTIDKNLPMTVNNYNAAHISLKDIDGIKKIFLRQKDGNNFNESISINQPKPHTTSVSGIVAGNVNDIDKIEGICPNVKIINGNDFLDSVTLSLTGKYTSSNINSFYFKVRISEEYLKKVNNKFPIYASDLTNIYSQKEASIINCSISWPLAGNNNDVLKPKSTDFILRELIAYGRQGRGVLFVFSAGNDGRTITETNEAYALSNKPLITAASKVILNSNQLDYYLPPTNQIFTEEQSNYSNKGSRVDICAPSSPKKIPDTKSIEIYAPTMINGGDIGESDQIITLTILDYQSNKIILTEVCKALFPGQSVELGMPFTFFHEIRFIKNINIENHISNGVDAARTVLTLDKDIEFTKKLVRNNSTIFDLKGQQLRITIFKKNVVQLIGNNKLILEDLRGIGDLQTPKQKIFIYSQENINSGIEAEILNVNEGLNQIEIDKIITYTLSQGIIVIPSQIKTKLKLHSGKIYVADNHNSLLGFFTGQRVYVDEIKTSRQLMHVTGSNGQFILRFDQFDTNGTSNYTIKSLAYGNFNSEFGGTSAAAPIVTGLSSLLLSVNPLLNVAEIKHILKLTADKIDGSNNYQLQSDVNKYNYGYSVNNKYGTGRVNAEAAVQLALDWHLEETNKPSLAIFDSENNLQVPPDEIVDSPDIFISSNPINNKLDLNLASSQTIKIRIHNQGNRHSFKECDIRLLMAFIPLDSTNTVLYSEQLEFDFPFPDWWYDIKKISDLNDKLRVSLLDVKEIGIIPQYDSKEIEFTFSNTKLKEIYKNYKFPNNRVFLLAHIAPFDGPFTYLEDEFGELILDENNGPINLSLKNIRHNKHLTCKEIIVSLVEVGQGTVHIPGNKLDITVGQELVEKTFDLSLENILETDLATTKVKATKVNRADQSEVSVFFSKNTNGNWEIEGGVIPDWITFEIPDEIASQYDGYKCIKFPHKITVNDSSEEIKIETLNA